MGSVEDPFPVFRSAYPAMCSRLGSEPRGTARSLIDAACTQRQQFAAIQRLLEQAVRG